MTARATQYEHYYNRNMKHSIIALCSLLTVATSATAQTMSLSQCREAALKNNKEMAAAIKQTEGARYTMKSYLGNFFPNFTATGIGLYSNAEGKYSSGSGNLPTFQADATGQFAQNGGFAFFPGLDLNLKIGTVYVGGVQVEQPIFMGGKIIAAYKMAKLGKEMSQLNETLTETEVILKTDEAYANVVKAKEMSKVAAAYKATLEELLKNVESAYNNGLRPQNDVLKVKVKLNESELSVRKAENALRLATMNLCHVIGSPLTTTIEVEEGFPEMEQQMTQATMDITSRPEYAILGKQEAIAKQQVTLNRSELLPKIGVVGAYEYAHGIELNDQTLFDKGSFYVMLNVNVPLFHFGERMNKVKAAKAKLEQIRYERENTNERMTLELAQASNNLDESRLESELSDRSLEQAEENMRVSKKQYEVGLETLSNYLEAQTLWQKAYSTKVDAHFQMYINYIAYQKAAGLLKTAK